MSLLTVFECWRKRRICIRVSWSRSSRREEIGDKFPFRLGMLDLEVQYFLLKKEVKKKKRKLLCKEEKR